MTNFLRAAPIAGLIVWTGFTAAAQSSLTATIPFAFAMSAGAEMPAGKYYVSKLENQTGTPMYRFLNMTTRQAAVVMASDVVKRPAADSRNEAQLTFRCAGETCGLSGIFRKDSAYGDGLRVPLKTADPTTQIVEIAIPFAD